MIWKIIVPLLLVFGIWVVIKNQGLKIQKQDAKIQGLSTALIDTTKALRSSRTANAALKEHGRKLEGTVAGLRVENADLKTDRATAISRAYNSERQQRHTDSRLRETSYALSAYKRKQAADEHVGGVGAINTTEKDSTLNGDVASLKRQLRNRDEVVIPELRVALGKETIRADKAEDQVSDLEREINGVHQKYIRVRSFVADKRSEAKGPFTRKRRKVLSEIDTKLEEAQKPKDDGF